MNKENKQIERANKIWEDYENAKVYQNNIGIRKDIPIFVDFVEGRQWPKPTERTKHMPRPVFNFIEMIVNNKVANVYGSPVKLNFVADNDMAATTKFTKFAEYQMKEMRMEDLDYIALKRDGAIKGTYIYYFYWDEKAPGSRGNYEGGLRCQLLDPLNVYFANPKENDEQKQEWIMWEDRLPVNAVKEMADEGIDKEKIVPDELESAYKEEEQKGSDLCTVLTRLFRKDGEVYYERATKGTIINEPTPLNPLLIEKLQKAKEDTSITPTHDDDLEIERDVDEYKAYYYPIVVGNWKPRDKSIYGRGEVENLIPNQKAINFEIAMQLLNHQELGWGKILVKPNALQGQEITNTPGEVITDHTPGDKWGITRLDGQGFSAGALQFAPQILDLTRTVTGATEILTGDMISKDLSGRAIAQLQAEGRKPIADLQRAFWRVKEKQGLVIAQFYKLFYENKKFSMNLSPEETEQMEEIYRNAGKPGPVPTTKSETFNGREYLDTPFNVVVEAGAGTEYSEIMAMEMLNNLFLNGAIQKMTSEQLEQFITLYPDTAMPFKTELKAIIRKQQRSELGQLKQVASQLQAENEILKQETEDKDKILKQLTGELQRSNKITEQLKNEYSNKLMQVNDYINRMSRQAQAQPQTQGGTG
jgi:hypothetical protein